MKPPPPSLLSSIAHLNQLLEQHQLDQARPAIQKLALELMAGGFTSLGQ